jgi:hypothetical protein
MKIRPGIRIVRAYGRTGMTKLIVAFRNFANVPKNENTRLGGLLVNQSIPPQRLGYPDCPWLPVLQAKARTPLWLHLHILSKQAHKINAPISGDTVCPIEIYRNFSFVNGYHNWIRGTQKCSGFEKHNNSVADLMGKVQDDASEETWKICHSSSHCSRIEGTGIRPVSRT